MLSLASGQLISRLLKTIFFLHFSETSANHSFFPSIGKVFFNEILHLLVETDIRTNNGFHKLENKRILFPLDKNSDSISQNEGFVKNIRFHYAEKLLSTVGISKNNSLKMAIKNGVTLILIMVSTSTKFALNQRTLDRKSDMKMRKSGIKHSIKKSFPTSWKNCFQC